MEHKPLGAVVVGADDCLLLEESFRGIQACLVAQGVVNIPLVSPADEVPVRVAREVLLLSLRVVVPTVMLCPGRMWFTVMVWVDRDTLSAGSLGCIERMGVPFGMRTRSPFLKGRSLSLW